MNSRATYNKILFLDLYGVLITPKSQLRAVGFSTFDKEAVSNLKNIVEKLNIHIVLTSTLRLTADWKERIIESFQKAGWDNPPIVDRTPHLYETRGEEIAAWLKTNKVEAFVILDDHDDVREEHKDNLVLCSSNDGLTVERAQFLIKKFH